MALIDMTNKEAQLKLGKIGLIAGSGNFPLLFLKDMIQNKTPFAVVGLEKFAEKEIKELAPDTYCEVSLPHIAQCRKIFKKHNVDTVIIIGSVNPSIVAKTKFINFMMLKVILKLLFYKKKHDGLFRIFMEVFEAAGFKVTGIQDAMPSFMVKKGLQTKTKPSEQDLIDIELAITESKNVGISDIGQAAIVKDNVLLDCEEPSTGTNGLIKRALLIKNNAQGGVMAKLTKPDQEERGDIPAIGFGTLQNLIEGKLNGIVIEAGYKTILEDKEKLIEEFDKNGIFLLAI